jgi:hypothetical protein
VQRTGRNAGKETANIFIVIHNNKRQKKVEKKQETKQEK